MQELTFAELVEVIEYAVERDNNNELLRAYEVTYAALQGVSLQDFKSDLEANKTIPVMRSDPTITEHKVEHYLDDYNWAEVM